MTSDNIESFSSYWVLISIFQIKSKSKNYVSLLINKNFFTRNENDRFKFLAGRNLNETVEVRIRIKLQKINWVIKLNVNFLR